jgi:DNA-binding NarL/FixJ family response regulator/energy-coupling factor transporter ATP-binding protein EcfA2
MDPDDYNPIFKLAADFVNQTSRSVFLTGKAGSGKTTFLKHIVKTTTKKCVVVAPTGVAAINAGGVTMHSFFQLPFGPYLPGAQSKFNGVEVADKNSLFRNIRFSRDKRDLLNELELLIIDEVSMVRCDMLDAMDAILRQFRKRSHEPFGGVQILYIGDLYQLPPVAKTEEWEILKDHYESPFFFHSQAARQMPPLYIELKKIYRQSDPQFINLLNRVRNNNITREDLQLLNSRYEGRYTPPASENYITLSTHNYKADAVNASELEKLPGKLYRFHGSIEGDFSDKSLPTEMELRLKEGAQVIFIKNDLDQERRYYNGKLAVVSKIRGEEITVTFPDSKNELILEKETWRNIRYTLNRETEKVEEEAIGSFTQYPIRLAWAITIHKSQGLTFHKAVLDAGNSFAAGQVYVALSRCSTFEGLILQSRITLDSISTDPRVIEFAQKEQAANELEALLVHEQQRYWAEQLRSVFDFAQVIDILENFKEDLKEKKLPLVKEASALADQLLVVANEKQEVARKFQPELNRLVISVPQPGVDALNSRMQRAIEYFSKSIMDEMLLPLQHHVDSLRKAAKVKKYLTEVDIVRQTLAAKLKQIQQASYGEIVFYQPSEREAEQLEKFKKPAIQKKGKLEKGSSLQETLAAFREGLDQKAIALNRGLAESTIAGHLAQLVKTGDIEIHELLPEDKLRIIQKAIEETNESSGAVKQRLGEEYTYGEIRMVANHLARLKPKL